MEERNICFIPPLADNVAATSAPTARQNPFVLLWRDITTFFSMIDLLPKLMSPWFTTKRTDELCLWGRNIFSLILLAFVTILEGLLITILFPVLPIFPGIITFVYVGLGYGIIYGLCAPTRGPQVMESSPDALQDGEVERRKDEKWIFINGTLVTSKGLRDNCNRIARIFGRPVTGLHNPTLGLIGDLIECVIQRSFSYNNYCTRYSYDYVKASLADPNIKKVVLIGHSQGAIVVSMVLDLLFADMPVEKTSKLEVYTFGCAASHFNNPLRAIEPNSQTARARVIPHIEHYANSDDLVTRWGVLYNVCTVPSNSFMGRVFVRRGATGHLLNQHYLSNMFPLPEEEEISNKGTSFLDEDVEVHEQLTRKREYFKKRNCPSFCQTSRPSSGSFAESEVSGRLSAATVEQLERQAGLDALRFVGAGRQVPDGGLSAYKAIDAKNNDRIITGRTVRELSRLWRYMGGMDPDRSDILPPVDVHDGRGLKN